MVDGRSVVAIMSRPFISPSFSRGHSVATFGGWKEPLEIEMILFTVDARSVGTLVA